ncbi:secretoglobin family 1D member 2-like [Hylobates moloch]|uniref:secretoglobin family 1D member 2-like n=1 Tax=Hylobates moloch TaxID=81572 RepID=UPI001364277E|nr:secretoglobin family 1D member 2-like [Hylobates moloch]
MKLSVCLVLVTLALCCYRANAVVCPALVSELLDMVFISEPLFKLNLAKFDALPEAVVTKLGGKRGTDQISLQQRGLIAKVLVTIVKKCSV